MIIIDTVTIIAAIIDVVVIPVAVGIILHIWKNRYNKRIEAINIASNKLEQNELLNLEVLMAIGKLSSVTAVSLKRGSTNGEIDVALQAFKEVQERYYSYIKTEYIKSLEV